jgi:hypothetical protein
MPLASSRTQSSRLHPSLKLQCTVSSMALGSPSPLTAYPPRSKSLVAWRDSEGTTGSSRNVSLQVQPQQQ